MAAPNRARSPVVGACAASFLLSAILLATTGHAQAPRTLTATVVKVVDGDTVRLGNRIEKVRYIERAVTAIEVTRSGKAKSETATLVKRVAPHWLMREPAGVVPEARVSVLLRALHARGHPRSLENARRFEALALTVIFDVPPSTVRDAQRRAGATR